MCSTLLYFSLCSALCWTMRPSWGLLCSPSYQGTTWCFISWRIQAMDVPRPLPRPQEPAASIAHSWGLLSYPWSCQGTMRCFISWRIQAVDTPRPLPRPQEPAASIAQKSPGSIVHVLRNWWFVRHRNKALDFFGKERIHLVSVSMRIQHILQHILRSRIWSGMMNE